MLSASCLYPQAVPAFVPQISAWYSIIDSCGRHAHFVYEFNSAQETNNMEHWICTTCGTQFAPSSEPPKECPICRDTRQYIGLEGQKWTTLAAMRADGFHNTIKEHE